MDHHRLLVVVVSLFLGLLSGPLEVTAESNDAEREAQQNHATKQINEECTLHTRIYREALSQLTPWALQMFDSSSKLPDGLMRGNVYQLGNYDECLAVRAPSTQVGVPLFRGRFCRVALEVTLIEKYWSPRSQLDTESLTFDSPVILTSETLDTFSLNSVLKNLLAHPRLTSSSVFAPGQGPTILNIPLEWSACAPSSCNDLGVANLAEETLNTILNLTMGGRAKVTAEVIPGSCFSMDDGSKNLDTGAWIMVAVLILLLVLMLGSTFYEYQMLPPIAPVTSRTMTLTSFSIISNLRQLLRTTAPRPGTLTCLNGIRVLSMAWVMLGHRYEFISFTPAINILDLPEKYLHDWSVAPIMNSPLSVDAFFFLSGLLTCYVLTNERSRGAVFNPFKYYVYRYVRVTPPLAMMAAFVATLAPFMTDGPLWYQQVQPLAKACQKNWWSTILYINNYIDTSNTCVAHSWYLMVDMQLSWLAPLVLLPLWRWPKLAKPGLGLLVLASCFGCFGVTYDLSLFWTETFAKIPGVGPAVFFRALYTSTPLRAVPFLCGIALGYYLSHTRGQRVILSKMQVALGWTLSTGVCLSVMYTLTLAYAEDYVYSKLDAAFYAGFHRLGWSLALVWIVFACVKGYGGPVDAILSWTSFQPLSTLSYCAYLTHVVLFHVLVAIKRNPSYISHFYAIHAYFADVFLTIPLALVLHLAVEAPALVLLRVAFHKDNVPAMKRENEENRNK